MAGISKKTYNTKKGKVTKYVITYRDIYGKQHTAGAYDTKKEALKHINDYEEVSVLTENITLGQVFKPFMDKAIRKYSSNTIKNYKMYYTKYFEPIQHLEYKKISTIFLQKFFDDIESQSVYVAQTCLKFAKSATNYAINHKLIATNKFNSVEKISSPPADINHLTNDEVQLVLDTCKKEFPQYFVLLSVFVWTGMREGEVFALEKSDFNPEGLFLRVNKQFTNNELKNKTKTDSSNRKVYIFESLAELIEEHIKTLNPENPLLFPNAKGKHLNANNLRNRLWKPLLKLCGITKRVRIHDIRGTYIDMTLSSGLSPKFTQNNVGHKRNSTTMDIYARNNEDMVNFAQYALNNAFKKCEQNVSKIENPTNKKIVPFPKRLAGTMF